MSMSIRGLSRQRMAVAGVAGLAVLGGGAYLITAQNGGDGGSTADRGVSAVAPAESPSAVVTTSATAVASADAVAPTSSAPSPAPSPSAKPSPRVTTKATRERDPAEVRREIREAREKAARDGIKLQRPPRTTGKALPQNLISTRTQQTSEGSIRITTAPGDLTGQADQLLAGDKGKKTGNSRCTQNVRFSRSTPAQTIPTMLLCWRTSANRSVVTMAVAKDGKPSTAASVAVIDREWAKLR